MPAFLARASIASLCALLLAAPGALAQDVQVDPDSPAGTEYQIPFEDARDDGGDASSTGRGDSASGEATGSSDANSGSDDSGGDVGGTEAPTGGENEDEDGSTGATSDPTTTLPTAEIRSATEQDADGMSPGLLILLVTAGVLALGGLAGWLARWRRGGASGDLMADRR